MNNTTNAVRLLEAVGVSVRTLEYTFTEGDFDGKHVADQIGFSHDQVFKTLVAHNGARGYFVFVIPVGSELDLKKGAKAAGQKSIEMLPLKELTPLTGYVRGGCSPVGMKKKLPTFLDETCQLFSEMALSAGMRGLQMIVPPEALAAFVGAKFADLTR